MYPDAPHSAEERKQVSLLRKALAPLLKDALYEPEKIVEELQNLAKTIADSKAAPLDLSPLKDALGEVKGAVEKNVPPAPEKTVIDLTKVETVLHDIAEGSKTAAEYQDKAHRLLTKAVFDMTKARLQGVTDPKDPRDYLNVRLTDGDRFYTAMQEFVGAVSNGQTSFTDGSNPARVKLVSDGSVPVTIMFGNTQTIAGSVSSTGMTTVASGIVNRVIKVAAYSLITSSTSAVTVDMRGNDAQLYWQVPLQAAAGVISGANLATEAPGYLFKLNVGAGLALNLSAPQPVTYSLSYWYDAP